MRVNPKGEDGSEAIPHIASIVAAYGDPTGKYTEFLKDKDAWYQSRPFWFYDQTAAVPNSPAAATVKRAELELVVPLIPFECPSVFQDRTEVMIDNDVVVTCAELNPFYF